MSQSPRHISPRIALLYLVISAVLWSTSGAFLKSIPSVHWLAIASIRSLFAALLFLPGIAMPRPKPVKLAGAIFLYCLLIATLMGSMQLATAAQGIWLQYIAPAVVAIWTWLVMKRRLQYGEIVAILLTCIAIGVISLNGSGDDHRWSVVLGLISGLGFGAFIVLLKSLDDTPPSSIFFWTNLGTFAVLLPLIICLHIPLPSTPHEYLLLAAMGIGQLALPYHFFQRGLIHTRAIDASLIVLLEPVLNPVWVYLLVRELPSPRIMIACGLIGIGLVIFALSGFRADDDSKVTRS